MIFRISLKYKLIQVCDQSKASATVLDIMAQFGMVWFSMTARNGWWFLITMKMAILMKSQRFEDLPKVEIGPHLVMKHY